MRRVSFYLVFAFVMIVSFTAAVAEEIKPVKYVFLFIGDGLSIPQRMMTEEYVKRTQNRGLFINQMENQAITSTQAANSFITDSAASGTAIACGEKTNNGRIGMDAAGTGKLQSIAEVARDNGRKVGIITSVTLNHATPAAFYGHNTSRANYYQLGLDLIASNFDYFGGGGIDKHDQTKDKMYKGDVYELAQAAGYTVCRTVDAIKALKPDAGKVIAVGSSGALPYALDKTDKDMKLGEFVAQGIELLDNPKGFFMMVEGGAIDWLCHANDAAGTLAEVVEFDESVKVAYEFYKKHPEDTLIVVTGDHETGGLTLGFAGTGYKSYIELLSNQKCSSAQLSKIFRSQGKDGKTVTFDEIKKIITDNTGLIFAGEGERQKGGLYLTENEEKAFEKAFNTQYPEGKVNAKSNALSIEAIRVLNNKASVAWTSGAHTALPVNTTAIGSESKLFSNMIDNTGIARRLKQVVR